MARKPEKHLTELEMVIMKVLWQRSPLSVDDLQAALETEGRPLARPSIRTMLSILEKKGAVTRKPDGRRFLYSPLVERDEASQAFLKDMVERVFEGSGADMVAALLDARMVAPGDIDRVRALLDEAEPQKETNG